MYRPHGRYRYTYGAVSLSERRSRILSLTMFAELARRRRNDSLGAADFAGAHQQHQHEYSRGCRRSPIRHCIPSRGECPSLILTTELALISILPDTRYSSLWHQRFTSRSRGFSPPTKRCSIMQSWSRKRSQTTGAITAATKRKMVVGSMRRGPHRQILDWIALSRACDLGNACHFGFGRSFPA
jgi:hypothetical protein